MKALDNFKVFSESKSALERAIGKTITYDIELNLEDKYKFEDEEIHWGLSEGDFVYGEEAQLIKEFDDCEMYKVYSCTGEKYIGVFDKASKVED